MPSKSVIREVSCVNERPPQRHRNGIVSIGDFQLMQGRGLFCQLLKEFMQQSCVFQTANLRLVRPTQMQFKLYSDRGMRWRNAEYAASTSVH